MTRKTFQKRKEAIEKRLNVANKNIFANFNLTTKILAPNIPNYNQISDLFGLGSEEIQQILEQANTISNTKVSADDISNTIIDILKTFKIEQIWYNNLYYFDAVSNKERFIPLNTKNFKKLTNNYYTTAVLVKNVLEQTHTKDELQLYESKTEQEIIQLNQNNSIDTGIANQLAIDFNTIPSAIDKNLISNIKSEGLKQLINNKNYNVQITSMTNIGMSPIFGTIPFKKKFINFLINNKASLSILNLYQTLLTNPALFFELKHKAFFIEKKDTLKQLNTYINAFNIYFGNTANTTNLGPLSKKEKELLKNQNSFFYLNQQSHLVKKTEMLRKNIHNSFIYLSNYLFPVDTKKIPSGLTYLQCNNILNRFLFISIKDYDWVDLYDKSNLDFKKFLLQFFSSFIKNFNFEQLSSIYSSKELNDKINYMFTVFIFSNVKYDTKSSFNKNLVNLNKYYVINALPILNVPSMFSSQNKSIIVPGTSLSQKLVFSSLKPFILTPLNTETPDPYFSLSDTPSPDIRFTEDLSILSQLISDYQPLSFVLYEIINHIKVIANPKDKIIIDIQLNAYQFNSNYPLDQEDNIKLFDNNLKMETGNYTYSISYELENKSLTLYALDKIRTPNQYKFDLDNCDEVVTQFTYAIDKTLYNTDAIDDAIDVVSPDEFLEGKDVGLETSGQVFSNKQKKDLQADPILVIDKKLAIVNMISIKITSESEFSLLDASTSKKSFASLLYQQSLFSAYNLVINHSLNRKFNTPSSDLITNVPIITQLATNVPLSSWAAHIENTGLLVNIDLIYNLLAQLDNSSNSYNLTEDNFKNVIKLIKYFITIQPEDELL